MLKTHRKKLSYQEIVDAFKDNYKDIKEMSVNFELYEEYLNELHKDIDEVLSSSFGIPITQKKTIDETLHNWIDYCAEDFHRSYQKYKLVCGMIKPGHKKSPHRIDESDIERARQYPIENIIEFNQYNRALCLFHDDTNPSMYKYDNTVYCFVCSKRADSIALYMALNPKKSFIEAVKSLM